MESERAMFNATIAEAAVQSCSRSAADASSGYNSWTCWWTPEVNCAIKLKKYDKAWLKSRTPEAADTYKQASQWVTLIVAEEKLWWRVRWGHQERLLISLEEILPNCPRTKKGKAALCPHCIQWARGAADLNWGYSWVVEGITSRISFNPNNLQLGFAVAVPRGWMRFPKALDVSGLTNIAWALWTVSLGVLDKGDGSALQKVE